MKKSKTSSEKIIMSLIVVIFILVLIIFVALKITTPKIEENNEPQNSFEKIAEYNYETKKQILPQNWTIIMREMGFDGENSREMKQIYKVIYNLVNTYIPEIQDASDTNVYYNENAERIKKDLGIESYEDFYGIVQKAQKLNKNSEFKDSEFDTATMDISNSDRIKVKLKIYFTQNQEIDVNMVIYEKEKDGKIAVFTE